MNDIERPSSAFVGKVLLVSGDAIAIEQLSHSLEHFALAAEVCTESSSAIERLTRAKFEAVIIDFRLGTQAEAILDNARHAASNEHAVLFTISDSETETARAFKVGSTFVLQRPLSEASIDLNLRTAYGLIVRERRRYFRCPVEVPVVVVGKYIQTVHGRTVNVSEGGMAVVTGASFRLGDDVGLGFTLPGEEFQFALEATVCWAREQRIGLQFTPHSLTRTINLQEWLSRRLEEVIPQSVKDKFSNVLRG